MTHVTCLLVDGRELGRIFASLTADYGLITFLACGLN